MSSGSNAPRKPNVAPTLFKASSKFLHGQGAAKSMKRQRPSGGASVERDALSAESNSNSSVDEGAKSKKRFVGVRQRPSGRWVAEIKDTTQKIRLWLGTFDSAEEGAKAYDSAARALRGANTRTNFVPAMACEGTTAPASKAARLIRLRQMAAAAKGAALCEKEASARNVADLVSQRGGEHSDCKVEPQVNDSPALVRQDLQESVTSSLDDPLLLPSTPPGPPAVLDEHTPPPSPPKPPRLIGRRHNVAPQLPSPKPEQEEDQDAPSFVPVHYQDNSSKPYHVESVALPSLPKLEPQQSITSENLSNAINHSLSPHDSSSPPPFPSPRSPFECVQASQAMADGDLQTVSMEAASDYHLKKERFLIQLPPASESSSFSTFTVENLVAPLPFHGLEAPLLMLRSDHTIISGLVAFSHHQLSSSCATNRDHVSVYPCEKDEVIYRGRSLRSCAMSFEEENRVTATETEKRCIEPRAAALTIRCKEEMDYESSEVLYSMETERKSDRFILREKEFAEIVPEIPWPDYVLMDETAMESGYLGLDLSCENSGVYTSAFDFSAEAIDRDSCTSVMLEHEHLSDESEFLLRMQYEHSSNAPAHNFPQECVLLTEEPPELDYTMSPPGPQETHISSSLWRLDDASACWDGQSSTETADVKASSAGDGECTSLDHEALWSSMDLPPLCMVA